MMSADGLENFEAILGALANMSEKDTTLSDARCPKCNNTEFVKVQDLFYEAIRRAEDEGPNVAVGPNGMSAGDVIANHAPPRHRSATLRVVLVTIPVAVAAFFVYRRFGTTAGQFALVATIIIALFTFLTRTRRLSDEYYDQKGRWNKRYMCTKCGQLVAG
jgi:DNA-directed RNA polymerase subunit RPC12/RpoP